MLKKIFKKNNQNNAILKKGLPVFGIVLLLLLLLFFLLLEKSHAAGSHNLKIQILSLCGNNIKELNEQCDGFDLAGNSCLSRGFIGGSLSCNTSCFFNTSECKISPSGGGVGGAVNNPPDTLATRIIFSGRAYPLSKVSILKDGQLEVTTIAGPNAHFFVTIPNLSNGNYNFSVFGEDSRGNRSTLFNFPVYVNIGAIIDIGGIFIPPIISVNRNQVKRGENIVIFGQSVPEADITIAINSEQQIFKKVKADKSGVYLYNFDTSVLEIGGHSAKSKGILNEETSPFGGSVGFFVGDGEQFINKDKSRCSFKADLNNDCLINLVDFSVAAYWHKRNLSVDFKKIEADKLNSDGKIDLTDFSIIAFYWTG